MTTPAWKPCCAGEEGDGGGGDDAGGFDLRAGLGEAGGEGGGDPGAGLAGVAAEEDFGLAALCAGSGRGRGRRRRRWWGRGGLAGDGADAVGAEELAGGRSWGSWSLRMCRSGMAEDCAGVEVGSFRDS